jgi:hypothetical protein
MAALMNVPPGFDQRECTLTARAEAVPDEKNSEKFKKSRILPLGGPSITIR